MDLSTFERSISNREKSLDSLETWLAWATALVVLGLVLEYWHEIPEAVEKIKIARRWLWQPACVIIGALLITIGVAGELSLQFLASRVETDLRSDSHKVEGVLNDRASEAEKTARGFDAKIAEANASAKASEADAGRANERAANAERVAKGLEAQIADAMARAKTAESQVESAKASAEEARAMTEAERTERLRLEAVVQPRSLSLDQRRRIGDALTSFSGHRVLVSSYGLDAEGAVLGEQILSTLRPVLGNSNVLDNRTSIVVAGGFQIGVHVRGPDSELAFIRALADALRDIGGLQIFVNQPEPRLGAMMGGGGTAFPAGTIFVTVMIGVKSVVVTQRMADRRVTAEQQARIATKLCRFGAHNIEIDRFSSDGEIEQLSKDIDGAIPRQCNGGLGFAVSLVPQVVAVGFSGIQIVVNDDATQTDKDFAAALVESLRAEGLAVDGPMPEPQRGQPLLGPRRFEVTVGVNGAPVKIAIGRRP